MPDFLVRSGTLCAVVVADGPVLAVQGAIAMWKEQDDGVLVLGTAIQVVDLDSCDAATTYLQTEATIALLNIDYEDPKCGLAVRNTTVS